MQRGRKDLTCEKMTVNTVWTCSVVVITRLTLIVPSIVHNTKKGFYMSERSNIFICTVETGLHDGDIVFAN